MTATEAMLRPDATGLSWAYVRAVRREKTRGVVARIVEMFGSGSFLARKVQGRRLRLGLETDQTWKRF